MKLGGAVFLTILVVLLLAAGAARRVEGFSDAAPPGDAAAMLTRMLQSASRLTTYLADPASLTDHFRRARMTPVEMARDYLKNTVS
jgi:hypothetical protein